MNGEKQHAISNKWRAAEELTKTDQELDAVTVCKAREAALSKLETVQKTIWDMEEEQARIEEQARLDEALRQSQRIQELEGNKKLHRTEVLEATQVLEEVDKLLSPSRPKLHPAYWRFECDPDTARPTEYPELEPAERAFFQELIQKCCHKKCNLFSVSHSECVFHIENKTSWEVYEAKKHKLVRRLCTARGGGTLGSSGGASAVSGMVPAVEPPLQTAQVQEHFKEERWDVDAVEAYLFHDVPSEEAVFEIADRGFNRHFALEGSMFGSGCRLLHGRVMQGSVLCQHSSSGAGLEGSSGVGVPREPGPSLPGPGRWDQARCKAAPVQVPVREEPPERQSLQVL
eukprot:104618-Rhodomonas_salina.1